jgi:hypothetical protein
MPARCDPVCKRWPMATGRHRTTLNDCRQENNRSEWPLPLADSTGQLAGIPDRPQTTRYSQPFTGQFEMDRKMGTVAHAGSPIRAIFVSRASQLDGAIYSFRKFSDRHSKTIPKDSGVTEILAQRPGKMGLWRDGGSDHRDFLKFVQRNGPLCRYVGHPCVESRH